MRPSPLPVALRAVPCSVCGSPDSARVTRYRLTEIPEHVTSRLPWLVERLCDHVASTDERYHHVRVASCQHDLVIDCS